jgi:hypothetical protein
MNRATIANCRKGDASYQPTRRSNSVPDLGNRHVEGEKAGDGTRTHDNHVGNVVLYQLSYTRMMPTPADANYASSSTRVKRTSPH